MRKQILLTMGMILALAMGTEKLVAVETASPGKVGDLRKRFEQPGQQPTAPSKVTPKAKIAPTVKASPEPVVEPTPEPTNDTEAQEKAEQEAKERAEQEAKERAEQEAREKVEAEAKQREEAAAQEKAEQEAREKAEQEAREKAEQEAKERGEQKAREEAQAEAREKEETIVEAKSQEPLKTKSTWRRGNIKEKTETVDSTQTSVPQRPKLAPPSDDCRKNCTQKQCEHNIQTKIDCISKCPEPHYTNIGCRAAQVSEEDIKTITDATNFGSITKDNFLYKMKNIKPLSTFWFNEKMVAKEIHGKKEMVPSIQRDLGDSAVTEDEMKQIKYVLEKMGNICKNNMLDPAKKLFNEKKLDNFPAAKKEMEQLERLYAELNNAIKKSKNNMESQVNMSISDFKEEYVAKPSLNFKNCTEKGSAILFQMNNADYENSMKKGCIEDCQYSNCQQTGGYRKCRTNCSIPEYTDACTKIAKKCKGRKCISPYKQYEEYLQKEIVCKESCVSDKCKNDAYAQNCFEKCKLDNLRVGCDKAWEARVK